MIEINIDKLNKKIDSLEESYVECIFQKMYIPLTLEALEKETEELKETLSEEDLKTRNGIVKESGLRLKSTLGTIEHLENVIPRLKKLRRENCVIAFIKSLFK